MLTGDRLVTSPRRPTPNPAWFGVDGVPAGPALHAGGYAAAGTVQTTTISVPGSMEVMGRPAAGTMRSTSCGV